MEVTIWQIDLFVKLIKVGMKCCIYMDIYWAINGSYQMNQLKIITKLCYIVTKYMTCQETVYDWYVNVQGVC
jgi:hypothetical protein